MGISEREHHIQVLEQFFHDYKEWGEDLELEQTIEYAISSLKIDLKYDLMYEGEDIYTKADMVAILTELQLDIEKHTMTSGVTNQGTWSECIACCSRIIQQKINALEGETK